MTNEYPGRQNSQKQHAGSTENWTAKRRVNAGNDTLYIFRVRNGYLVTIMQDIDINKRLINSLRIRLCWLCINRIFFGVVT